MSGLPFLLKLCVLGLPAFLIGFVSQVLCNNTKFYHGSSLIYLFVIVAAIVVAIMESDRFIERAISYLILFGAHRYSRLRYGKERRAGAKRLGVVEACFGIRHLRRNQPHGECFFLPIHSDGLESPCSFKWNRNFFAFSYFRVSFSVFCGLWAVTRARHGSRRRGVARWSRRRSSPRR